MKQNKRVFLTFLLTLLAFTLVIAGCGKDDDNPVEPNPHDSAKTQMQAMLDSMVTEGRLPGAILAVKFPDGDVWTGFSGVADLSTNRELTTTTPMKIGSVSKTFTATVVLKLVEDGMFGLDDSLATYLPDSIRAYLPEAQTDSVITIRRVLNHTTGILNYVHIEDFVSQYQSDPTRIWTPEELLAFTTDTLLFDPGTNWSYSNTNYIYLGLMVEHLTGHTMQEEIQSIVFDPLSMDHSWFPQNDSQLPVNIAQGYYDFNQDSVLEASETITDADPSASWSAGAVVSTSDDLLIWIDALVSGSLLTPELQTQREQTIDFSLEGESYGYGLGIAHQAGVAWGHQGGIDGFNAVINRHQAGYDFIALVNGESPIFTENAANIIYTGAVKRLIGGPAKRMEGKVFAGTNDYFRGVSILPPSKW